jgi:uncharacterized protein (DUF2267 family)
VNDGDLLTEVQRRGRLHGRNEARRVVCGVLEALGDILPGRATDLLLPQLPDEIRSRPLRRDRCATPANCRAFLERVSTILYAEPPENAFLARVVLEQLNTTLRVITPAAFTHLVAADLRPLLRSGRPASVAAGPVERLTGLIPTPSAQPPRTARNVGRFDVPAPGSALPATAAVRR